MSEPSKPSSDKASEEVVGETPDGPVPEAPRGPPPTAYVADLMLVGVCAWFLWSDYHASQVGEVKLQIRTWTFMLNLTCAFVLVHRAMALVQRSFRGPRMSRLLGALKWGLAIVAPVAVAGHMEREAQLAHKAKLDRYVTVVSQAIGEARADGGPLTVEDLQPLDSPYLTRLTVRTDTGAFLVRISLPAVDIDGYTGLYASTEGRWHIHHNDLEPGPGPSFDASGPTIVCTPAKARLSCR
jgi:hypothetical protein